MRVVVLLASAPAVVLIAFAGARDPDCATAVQQRRWRAAVPVCEVAYRDDPRAGLHLAMALLYSEQIERAGAIAAQVVASGEPATVADAAYIAGVAALQRHDRVQARAFLAQAQAGHGAAPAKRARDAQQLAGVHASCGEYRTALRVVIDAEAAARDEEPLMRAYFAIARADLYRRLGDDIGAQRALDQAQRLVTAAKQDAAADGALETIELKRGIVDLDARRYRIAEVGLRRLRARTRSIRTRVSADLNLAWLASQAGRTAEADAILAGVPDDGSVGTATAVDYGRAWIALGEDRLDDAEALLARAEVRELSDEWQWEVPLQRAYVARRRGDVAAAEVALRRAVSAVEAQQRGDRRFFPSGGLRRPYDELFALLAEAGRWDEALAQLVALDRTRLGAASAGAAAWGARDAPPTPCDPPAGPDAPAIAPAAVVAALRASSRAHELVVVTLGGGKLWRLELRDGAITGRAVAEIDAVRALLDRVVGAPDDEDGAAALGELVLPASRRTDPLYVATLGELATIPLAALRIGGARLIDRRAVVRLSPLAVAAPPAADATAPLVLGDPVPGDPQHALPAAAAEARWVAAYLGAQLALGPDATWAALVQGRPRVLHVATHVALVGREVVMRLGDQRVTAAQVERHDWSSTRLVVLAACGSAAAIDPEGRDSIASAFLRNGAGTVLATIWSINDAQTELLVRAFYAAGGADDPAGALVQVQRRLAGTVPARHWAAFVVMAPAPP